MLRRVLIVVIPLAAIACFAWVIMYTLEAEPHHTLSAKSLKSPQQAAAALGIPPEGELTTLSVDSRFDLFDGFERAQIPLADHFESPMGARNGAFTYNAQGFHVHNPQRGGYHLGDDINGIGGQNSDFGDPVYVVSDGLVVYAAKPSKGWGNVMVVAHRLRDGRLIQSLYAHLATMRYKVGDLVGRGHEIGTVGSADGAYYAHLHFELRESDGVFIGAGYSKSKESWGEQLDPTVFAADYNQKAPHEVGESVLKMRIDQEFEKKVNKLQNALFSSEGKTK